MKQFKVIMVERQKDVSLHELRQVAYCDSRQEVIDWYGLEEPDIESYSIEEVE